MPDKQRAYGQFVTPIDVADLLLGFCMRNAGDKLLDPSCGAGAILSRATQMQQWLDPSGESQGELWGVELDPESVAKVREAVPGGRIVEGNFFDMTGLPEGPFDAIVGNPPYTRAEWIKWFDESQDRASSTGQQLTIFEEAGEFVPIPRGAGDESLLLSRRAGLHTYFFLHGTQFLREGGRFGFVVTNSWLDVAYGERLKQYLLEHYKILALIESNVERWFVQARINTCIIILEKCGDADQRAANQVKLVRIRRPLRHLIPFKENDRRRLLFIRDLITPVMAQGSLDSKHMAIRAIPQRSLGPSEKWGYILRAPDVLLQRTQSLDLHPMRNWAAVRRGYTTGANSFFYMNSETVEEWGIEAEFRSPLLKSFRYVDSRSVSVQDCNFEVLTIKPDADIGRTAVADYLDWGESQDFNLRRTCRGRQPWYSLPEQEGAPILMAKGIWQRHFAPLTEELLVDQQLYQTYLAGGVPVKVAAALLNSAWFQLQLELHGRVNFGEGVLWLATYEIENLLLPDPRYLDASQSKELTAAFDALLERKVGPVQEETMEADWQTLNAVVFDILGLSPMEGVAITESLLERMATRKAKAGTTL